MFSLRRHLLKQHGLVLKDARIGTVNPPAYTVEEGSQSPVADPHEAAATHSERDHDPRSEAGGINPTKRPRRVSASVTSKGRKGSRDGYGEVDRTQLPRRRPTFAEYLGAGDRTLIAGCRSVERINVRTAKEFPLASNGGE